MEGVGWFKKVFSSDPVIVLLVLSLARLMKDYPAGLLTYGFEIEL